MGARPSKVGIYAAITLSGIGGLTWEILWQHESALLLGVSSHGTAITLASLMGGLGLGAFAVSRHADRIERPVLAYGVAAATVALGGLLVAPGMRLVAAIDPLFYGWSTEAAWILQLVATAALIMVPATAMGATLPLLASCARDLRVSMAQLYAANTAGAVVGILLASFVSLPMMGVHKTSLLAATLDLGVAGWAFLHSYRTLPLTEEEKRARVPARSLALAFYSGFAVLALEVSWFRSLRAAFQASTESFAVILAAFLLPLAVSAAIVPRFAQRRGLLYALLFSAGFAVLTVTSFVDRMDEWVTADFYSPMTAVRRFAICVAIMGPPVSLIGGVLPTLLARHVGGVSTGRLLAANTVGAIAGTLIAGFVTLPWIGATCTSWAIAASMFLVGFGLVGGNRRHALLAVGAAAAAAALVLKYHGGTARERVQGFGVRNYNRILFVSEGPDSTVWVAHNNRSGKRRLVIDGFEASGEDQDGEHYMRWMGHLPALAHEGSLENALVICFGTGQTADAVRQHGPARLDIADVNPAVFEAAPLFTSNNGVLSDPSVRHFVMDGRKFLRRHQEPKYDLITLEPMPPNFAGTNNLYSTEFYELARSRLAEGGVVAQWLPMHIMATSHMKAILGSFVDVFPHSKLWIDPVGGTGIVVGSSSPWTTNAPTFPLDLDHGAIARGYLLDGDELRRLTAHSERVTDDNQLLSYGLARLTLSTLGDGWPEKLYQQNLASLAAVARGLAGGEGPSAQQSRIVAPTQAPD
jgi:spermidine synthase